MEPIREPDHEARTEIAAPPEVVWEHVSEITRTPEWSPVVKRCEWLDDERRPVVGARFRGHNRFNGFRWSRECVVTEAEPGSVFSFSTFGGGEEQTRWRYGLEPHGEGTRVTLAYEIVTVPRWVRILRRLPGGRATNERQARRNIEESLERLRRLVEASPVSRR